MGIRKQTFQVSDERTYAKCDLCGVERQVEPAPMKHTTSCGSIIEHLRWYNVHSEGFHTHSHGPLAGKMICDKCTLLVDDGLHRTWELVLRKKTCELS